MTYHSTEQRRDNFQLVADGSQGEPASADRTQEPVGEWVAVAGGGEPSATATPLDPAYHRRQERINDLRANAYLESDALAACIGGVNSDLLEIQLSLAEHIRRSIATTGSPLEGDENFQTLEIMLRVTKQITQHSQISLRLRKSSDEAVAAGSLSGA